MKFREGPDNSEVIKPADKLNDFRRAITLLTRDGTQHSHFQAGWIAMTRRDYEIAFEQFKLAGNLPRAAQMAGRLGRYKEGIDLLSEAAKKEPHRKSYYYTLALELAMRTGVETLGEVMGSWSNVRGITLLIQMIESRGLKATGDTAVLFEKARLTTMEIKALDRYIGIGKGNQGATQEKVSASMLTDKDFSSAINKLLPFESQYR